MKMTFKNIDGIRVTAALVNAIQKNKAYLSEIDGAIGDGDHGINMNKGFTMYAGKFAGKEVDFTTELKNLGRTLLGDIGGSMGPLYGSFFIEMSKQTKGFEEIDRVVFGNMLEAAAKGIKELGNAQVGDKTLIDTLDPAVSAYKAAIEKDSSFVNALSDMKAAAVKGRDSTIDLVARIGRASRLGERSRGILDAGATSCCLILCTMADEVIKLLKEE